MSPALAGTGSTMTAAISAPSAAKSFSSASVSLKGSVMVSAASASGTPALSGCPWVSAPLPARTSSESTCPW